MGKFPQWYLLSHKTTFFILRKKNSIGFKVGFITNTILTKENIQDGNLWCFSFNITISNSTKIQSPSDGAWLIMRKNFPSTSHATQIIHEWECCTFSHNSVQISQVQSMPIFFFFLKGSFGCQVLWKTFIPVSTLQQVEEETICSSSH